MAIYVGIGGWVFEEWRDSFYPAGLSQKKELGYASSKLTSIEVNGTYYGAQKPETFAKWRDETPDGFIFTLKGNRFATNRKVLADSKDSVEKFLTQGITELKSKLGPINWQFMATKKFDPSDMEDFLKLLPAEQDGVPLRHALEVRHPTFQCAEFVDLCRKYNAGIITGCDDPDFPVIADRTTDFAYLRLMGTKDEHPLGYSDAELDTWVARIKAIADGKPAEGLDTYGTPMAGKPKDVYVYVISGHKVRNPHAAMALIERLK